MCCIFLSDWLGYFIVILSIKKLGITGELLVFVEYCIGISSGLQHLKFTFNAFVIARCLPRCDFGPFRVRANCCWLLLLTGFGPNHLVATSWLRASPSTQRSQVSQQTSLVACGSRASQPTSASSSSIRHQLWHRSTASLAQFGNLAKQQLRKNK